MQYREGRNDKKGEIKQQEVRRKVMARAKVDKSETASKTNNQKEKEKQTMPPVTMTNDEIDFSAAEDFKLPTAGVHQGNLAGVELVATKKYENKDQFVLTAHQVGVDYR